MTILRDISFLWSMIHIVALFLLLFEPRYSWRVTLTVGFAGVGTLLVVNVLAMLWWGHGIVMSAAFFTCTLPSLLLFFVLSKYRDGRFFFLFCLTDTTCFWLLQITNFLDRITGDTYVVLLVSRLLVFPVVEFLFWRYLRHPYLELQRRLEKGWWLFVAVGALYYLLIMFTAVPVDVPLPDAAGLGRVFLVLALMPLTYLTILHSLWRQMQMYENSRQMELQRRDYDSIRQKMELGRVYRHDMRHHLSALDALLQQGDSAGALQYVRVLGSGLDSISQSVQCANATVNAVLSAYADQAANAGCTLEVKEHVPEELPFGETDLCVILANALENALRACQSLPQHMRAIHLEIELTENRRLVLLVENPCPQPVKFGSDGLPDVPRREGHGLGLRSIQAVAEKYSGLFRCQWEKGRFTLRVVLMPPAENPPNKKRRKIGRAGAAIFSVLFCLTLFNCVPAVADTLESVPILGGFFKILDIRTYSLRWGAQELLSAADETGPSSGDSYIEEIGYPSGEVPHARVGGTAPVARG